MRLLNANTCEFQEFFESDIPPYIILSHRWGKDEVSYQIFSKRHKDKHQPFLSQSAGYRKILDFCNYGPEIYRRKNSERYNDKEVEWVWVDTCCIDKTSSAELSEAINSMFGWYNKARLCCVYLGDVADAEIEKSRGFKHFRRSEWFSRGWTLQELLAPPRVEFLDAKWRSLGDKWKLKEEISRITNIQECYLEVPLAVLGASIATRISWASKRRTSRVEDLAYCLLGLLDVNMPLLYGEGRKAFRRLQEELIRTSNDESVFAWAMGNDQSLLLAPDPSWFEASLNIDKGWPEGFYLWKCDSSHTMSNLGVQMQVRYIRDPDNPGTILAFLNCHESGGTAPFIMELRIPSAYHEEDEMAKWTPVNRNQTEIRKRLPEDLQDLLERHLQCETLFIEA